MVDLNEFGGMDRKRSGKVDLDEGLHDFRAWQWQGEGGAGMHVTYQGPDTDDKEIEVEGYAKPKDS